MFKNQRKETNEPREKWFSFVSSFVQKYINMITLYRRTEVIEETPKVSFHNKEKLYVLIYFTRRKVKFLCELWEFTVKQTKSTKFLNLTKINKKLLTLERTINLLLKTLPVYQLFKNKNFDFNFEVEVKQDEVFVNEGKSFQNEKQTISFNDIYDNSGSIGFSVYYIDQNILFNTEEEAKQDLIKSKIELRNSKVDLLSSQNFKISRIKEINETSILETFSECSSSQGSSITSKEETISIFDSPLENSKVLNESMVVEKNKIKRIMYQYKKLNDYRKDDSNSGGYEESENSFEDDDEYIDKRVLELESSYTNEIKIGCKIENKNVISQISYVEDRKAMEIPRNLYKIKTLFSQNQLFINALSLNNKLSSCK